MSRSRAFAFTLNNPDDHVESKTQLDEMDCKYIIYGHEVGESGTPHLQGTIVFANAKTLSAAIKCMPKACHVEICKDLFASIKYCEKDGKITERGQRPLNPKEKGEKEKDRWEQIITAAEEGNVEEIPAEIRFKHWKAVQHFQCEGKKKRKFEDTEDQMEWYYGPSGTGKSRKARTEHPDAYLKMCNKWWDGYNDEEVVIIEDIDKKHDVLCHHLKIWADRYPFLAEVKGGALKIRPKKIIVTSNWSPEEIWTDAQDLEPILRRFKLTHFNKPL